MTAKASKSSWAARMALISVAVIASTSPSLRASMLLNWLRKPPEFWIVSNRARCMSGECALRAMVRARSHIPSCAWDKVSSRLAAMVRVFMSVVFIFMYNILVFEHCQCFSKIRPNKH